MDIEVVQQRLDSYHCKTRQDEHNALKEITQEIALMALSKTDFFKLAEFHGGTALRILHSLQRFSEDLDFALLAPNADFDLNHYLFHVSEEFEAFGYKINISDRSDVQKTVQKQFLKVDSLGKMLTVQYPMTRSDRQIKIKFEVDTNPPTGANTEIKFLLFPIPFSVLAKDLPSSFAGKIHALLCRKYNKGRDWYDFIWYMQNRVPVNYELLANALKQVGPWQDQGLSIDRKWLVEQFKVKINSIDWEMLKNDVKPLLKPSDLAGLALWKAEFFLELAKKI